MKLGIPALADVYGQSRPEFNRLKERARYLLHCLRDELARLITVSFLFDEIVETAESGAPFVTDAAAAPSFVLLSNERVAAVFRAGPEFSFAFIDMVLGRNQPPTASTGSDASRRLTIAETYICETLLTETFIAAARSAQLAGDDAQLEVIRAADPARLEAIAIPERILAATVGCALADRACSIGIGLPLSDAGEAHPKRHPAAAENDNRIAGLAKTRSFLSGAALELRAVLGTTTFSLTEIGALGVGSVISLHKLNSSLPRVELYCGQQLLCCGTVVEHRGWHRFLLEHKGE